MKISAKNEFSEILKFSNIFGKRRSTSGERLRFAPCAWDAATATGPGTPSARGAAGFFSAGCAGGLSRIRCQGAEVRRRDAYAGIIKLLQRGFRLEICTFPSPLVLPFVFRGRA